MSKEIATLFIFCSESNPAKSYQTLVYVDGSTSCDCPAWIYKLKCSAGQRTCKHLRWVDAGLGNQHAQKVVEYSNPVIVRRVPQRAMTTEDLPNQRRRVFDLEAYA